MADQQVLAPGEMAESESSRKEIYTYDAPWTVQAMAWSHRYVSHHYQFAHLLF